MGKESSIPLAEAKEYLRLVNEYFGFRYSDLERYYIYLGTQHGHYELVPQLYSKDRIEELFTHNWDFRYQEYKRALNVLWINANRNFISEEIIKTYDRQIGKLTGSRYYADILRLYKFVNNVGQDKQITISSGAFSYVLDNTDGWFHKLLKWTYLEPPSVVNASSELERLEYKKTGSKASDEKNGVAFGVYRLFKDEGLIKRCNDHFMILLWDYLRLLGLEGRERNSKLQASLTSTLSRFRRRATSGTDQANFHFQDLPDIFFD